MTTIAIRRICCSLCGHCATQPVVASTSIRGEPDLDSRPKWMAGVSWFVAQCSRCGYAAPDLEAKKNLNADHLRSVVSSPEYRTLNQRTDLPEPARRMLCHALIVEAEGDSVGAGWASLWSAWCCDDGKDGAGADSSRELALEHFGRALAGGQRLIWSRAPTDVEPDSPQGEEPVLSGTLAREQLVLSDVQRRLGRFPEAIRHCTDGLAAHPDEPLRRLLHYEMLLARRGDQGCYNESHAMNRMSPEAIRWSDRLMSSGCLCQCLCVLGGCAAALAGQWKAAILLVFSGILGVLIWKRVVDAGVHRLSQDFRRQMEAGDDGVGEVGEQR